MLLHNKNLKSLSVNLEWIPDQSYQHLSRALMKNDSLRDLKLDHCSMTNTNMELTVQGLGLNPHKNLRSLGLHNVHMQPDCLKPLASYLANINPKRFEELVLSNLNLSDAALDDISMMLSNNTGLSTLKMISCLTQG